MTTFISIHALREEGDSIAFAPLAWQSYFYPRPPRGGRLACVTTLLNCGDFYPRPPRGGRHIFRQSLAYLIPISIHALREEGDYNSLNGWATDIKFLSTPSARRATKLVEQRPRRHYISIHALREEGDRFVRGRLRFTDISIHAPREEGDAWTAVVHTCLISHFYPRPPRGGRQEPVEVPDISKIFLSTPPARRATGAGCSGHHG